MERYLSPVALWVTLPNPKEESMRRLALAVPFLALLAACQPATTELTEEQKAEIAAEVTAIHDEMWDAWPDLAQGMSFFDSAPDVGWGWDGEVRFGSDNIGAWFEPTIASFDRFEITFDERRTVVLSQDVVCVTERGVSTAYDSTGSILGSGPLAATVVWVRRNGEWKIAAGHESTPVPEVQ